MEQPVLSILQLLISTFTNSQLAGLDTGFTEEFQRIMGSLVELPARTEG